MARALRSAVLTWWFALAIPVVGCAGTEGPVLRANDGAPPAAGAGGAGPAERVWVPTAAVAWQVQLAGSVDRTVDVELFIIDLASEADAAALRSLGRRVVCYFSAGTYEPWRDDLDAIASRVAGNPVAAYPDERWLDVGDPEVRRVMQERILTASAACDGVLPANLDGYAHDSGFSLTLADATEFGRALAETAHGAGLSIVASSTVSDLAFALEPSFDWAFSLGCLTAGTCPAFDPFSARGKPLLVVEVAAAEDRELLCGQAAAQGINLLLKEPDLGAFRLDCPV